MLTLTAYGSDNDAAGIVVDDVDEIAIIDSNDNDVTSRLKEDLILYDGDESSFLELVFGAGLAFLALCAVEAPLILNSDINRV